MSRLLLALPFFFVSFASLAEGALEEESDIDTFDQAAFDERIDFMMSTFALLQEKEPIDYEMTWSASNEEGHDSPFVGLFNIPPVPNAIIVALQMDYFAQLPLPIVVHSAHHEYCHVLTGSGAGVIDTEAAYQRIERSAELCVRSIVGADAYTAYRSLYEVLAAEEVEVLSDWAAERLTVMIK